VVGASAERAAVGSKHADVRPPTAVSGMDLASPPTVTLDCGVVQGQCVDPPLFVNNEREWEHCLS
jgi:hypothetical protein